MQTIKILLGWIIYPSLVLIFSLTLFSFTASSFQMDSLQAVLARETSPSKQIDLILKLAEKNQDLDLKKSYEYAHKAEGIAQKLNIDSVSFKVKFSLASIYFQQGEYNKALAYYLFCDKYAFQKNDDRLLLHTTANIGAVYHMMADYDNAQAYYSKARQLLKDTHENYSSEVYLKKLIALYNNMGNNCNKMNDTINGLNYYKKALTLAIDNNDTYGIGFINRNIAEYFLNHQKPDSAKPYLDRSYSLLLKSNNQVLLSSAYFSLGKYHSMLKDYPSAINMYHRCIEQALKSGAMGAEKEVYLELYNLHKKMNNYQDALTHLETYKSMSDSLNNRIHLRELMTIQHNVEIEKQAFEQQERKKRMDIYMIAGIIIFIIAVIVFVLIIRLYKIKYGLLKIKNKSNEQEKVRLDNQIEVKNKELATNVLYLTQKNVLVTESINILQDILPEMTVTQQHALKQVMQNLEKSTKTGGWEEFELLFQKTNKDFYEALNVQFPKLTLNERRLCAFIRLNLSNKDIMSITGQSLRALEMGRHRLRKKLKITDSSVQIAQFLAELDQKPSNHTSEVA